MGYTLGRRPIMEEQNAGFYDTGKPKRNNHIEEHKHVVTKAHIQSVLRQFKAN